MGPSTFASGDVSAHLECPMCAWCSQHGKLAGENGVIVGGPQKLRRAVQIHLDEQVSEAHTDT